MKINKSSFFIFSIIASLFVGLNGCKRQNNLNKKDNEISVALGAAPSSLDPVKATDATGMRMVSLVYQGLIRVDQNLKPTGDLAYKWNTVNNQISFYIKQTSKFSDGSLISCQDLIKSIQNYQADNCPFRSVFNKIQKPNCIATQDDLVLSFKVLANIDKFLLADLPVLKILKENEEQNAIGTGAFTINKKTPADLILATNTFYKEPQTYNLKFYFLKDDFARFLKVYKGEIDVAANSIPFEKISSFEGTDFEVIEKPSLSTSYLLINFQNKDLQNINFRKKIYKSLDIPNLVTNRFENHVTQARSLLSPEHPYYAKSLNSISHNKSESKINSKMLTLKTSNARQSRETGKILAQTLRSEGIPTVLQSFEWGTYYKDVKSGRYDLALMKWVGVVDPDLYNLAFHSSEFSPGRNRGYYKNTDVDQLLDKAKNTKSVNERKKYYSIVQTKVFKDLAIIPLWHENQVHIIHPRIKGYKLNPMGDFTSLLNLEIQKGL